MKFPSLEVRKARSVFTGKLQSILSRLDECAARDITCSFLGRKRTSLITVTDVWVVGSYARGATHCGDLDLVVKTTGGYVTSAGVNTRLLGKLPDVRAYLGTPEENESGIRFPEAVKVWGAGLDWAAALADIVENPTATRFPRKTDVIPLRNEQLRVGVDLAEAVVDAHKAGVLTWSFIPLDALSPAELTDDDLLELDRLRVNSAKRRLVPYVKAYLATLPLPHTSAEKGFDGDFWMQDGTWVLLGLGLPNYDLLNRPGISRIAAMPELNIRGPNGIWVLERGPEHPLTKVFSGGASAWLVADGDRPRAMHHIGSNINDFAIEVEAFGSREEALDHIVAVYGDDDPDEYGPLPEPMYVAGADYLAALRGVELVDYVGVGKVVAFSANAARVARGSDAEYPGLSRLPDWFDAHFAATPAGQVVSG